MSTLPHRGPESMLMRLCWGFEAFSRNPGRVATGTAVIRSFAYLKVEL